MQFLQLKVLKNPFLPAFLLALLFLGVFTMHTFHRHSSFHSHAFDLGIYTQAIYLFSHNLPIYSSLKGIPILADHFGLILVLLSPIFLLFPDAKTLLFIQALFVSLSVIPIYAIAVHRLKDKLLAIMLSLSYLTSTGIVQAVNFDFHLTTISVLPIACLLWAWYFKRWKLYFLILILAVFFKEDIPLLIFGLGAFQILIKDKKVGILTCIFAIFSFLLIKKVIMPFIHPSGAAAYIETSILPLNDPLNLIIIAILRPDLLVDQFFNSPVKIQTFQTLIYDFGLLPLLSPLFWLGVFPYLYLRFTSNYIQIWGTTYHHNANLEPFLVISAILAINALKIPKKAIIILLTVVLITQGLSPKGLILSAIPNALQNNPTDQKKELILKQLPSKIGISAQSSIIPHIANRQDLFLYPNVANAQLIILDPTKETYPLTGVEMKNRIQSLKNSPSWKIYQEVDNLIIFQIIYNK